MLKVTASLTWLWVKSVSREPSVCEFLCLAKGERPGSLPPLPLEAWE